VRRSLAHDESGRAGPAILLGLVGAVVGGPIGFFTGGFIALAACGRGDGSLGAGESCGMLALFLVVLGVPIGAVVGAVTGAVIGSRRPRVAASIGDAAIVTAGEDGGPSTLGGPPVEREASPLAALAVIGGIAIAFGAFSGWRTVSIPYEDLERYANVLTPGPEGIAFLGGLLALAGGTLAVLRPAGAAPPLVVAIGTALAAGAALWALVDLLGVPSELQWQIFVGYWISVAGVAVAAVGWLSGRRRAAG
jgi:hypothetical protein